MLETGVHLRHLCLIHHEDRSHYGNFSNNGYLFDSTAVTVFVSLASGSRLTALGFKQLKFQLSIILFFLWSRRCNFTGNRST